RLLIGDHVLRIRRHGHAPQHLPAGELHGDQPVLGLGRDEGDWRAAGHARDGAGRCYEEYGEHERGAGHAADTAPPLREVHQGAGGDVQEAGSALQIVIASALAALLPAVSSTFTRSVYVPSGILRVSKRPRVSRNSKRPGQVRYCWFPKRGLFW